MRRSLLMLALVWPGLAAPAHAEWLPGSQLSAPWSFTRPTITFLRSDADAVGILSFILPSTTPGEDPSVTPLLNSRTTPEGTSFDLPTLFRGEQLHFAFRVIKGPRDSFRTDDPRDAVQYRYRQIASDSWRFGIEAIRSPSGDNDFDDIEFAVRFAQVPAPGAAAPLIAAALFCSRRRRL